MWQRIGYIKKKKTFIHIRNAREYFERERDSWKERKRKREKKEKKIEKFGRMHCLSYIWTPSESENSKAPYPSINYAQRRSKNTIINSVWNCNGPGRTGNNSSSFSPSLPFAGVWCFTRYAHRAYIYMYTVTHIYRRTTILNPYPNKLFSKLKSRAMLTFIF